MRKFLFSLFLLALLAGNGWGAIYYVNQTGGSDANDGLSTGSAWKTIAKVNASSYAAGDFILFKRGETWREQLEITSSGTPGNVITFSAYGSGSNPIINGSNIISTWTKNTNNVWTSAVTTQPNQVFFNGTRGTHADNVGEINNTNKWYWSENVLYIYSTTDPSTTYTTQGVEASQREFCVKITNKSNLNVNGLICKYPIYDGFYAYAGGTNAIAGITWDSNTATYVGRNGFYLENDNAATTDNFSIIRCTGTYNGSSGFEAVNLTTGSNRVTVDNCTFHHNGQINDTYAVATYSNMGTKSTKLTIKNCNIYNQERIRYEGAGIQFDNETNDNIAEYNYVHDNEGVGIHSGHGGDNNDVRYNIVVNNALHGIVGNSAATGTRIYNNIVYRSDSGVGQYGLFFFDGGIYAIKNNIVFGSYDYSINNGTNTMVEACTNNLFYGYGTGATHNVTCTSSVISDPRITDLTNGVFTLQASSPAINAGTSVGLTRDFSGNPVPFDSAPDIGAYEFSPGGGVDRGGGGCSISPEGKLKGESRFGTILALFAPWIFLVVRKILKSKKFIL